MPGFAALAVGAMAVELASFFFLLRAFAPTEFSTALATYPYIVLAGDIPVSFGGVGVRESAAAFLLSPYSVSSGAAVGASLVWFVFVVLAPAALGAVWLAAERLRAHVRRSDRLASQPAAVWIAPPPDLSAAEGVAPDCETTQA
jgi:uncharacterized membrane protein YbhN (UPF0104 family)